MKRTYLTLAAVAAMLAAPAFAEPMDKDGKWEPAKTRTEAIARAEKHLGELKAMSDEDWAKKRAEKKQAWEKRQEERKARRAESKEKRKAKMGERKAMDKEAPAAGKPAADAETPAK